MNFTFKVELSQAEASRFGRDVLSLAREHTDPIQAAMAIRYGAIVKGNFGENGEDRPKPWPMLSQQYAKRVGREYATLYVSGALESAVKVDTTAATVSVSSGDVPYALAHQFGNKNLPARPYFPMHDNGEATEYSIKAVTEAAREEARNQF